MDIADRFAIRYYEWSLERSKEEFRSAFPLLSLVRGSHVFKFLEVVETLQPDLRSKFSAALVKRFHPRAAATGAFNISSEEQQLVDLYLEHGYEKGPAGEKIMLPYGSERERALKESLESGTARRPNRSAVKKLVRKLLSGSINQSITEASGELICETGVHGWTMRTCVDFGHTWGSMISYSHVLIPAGRTPLPHHVHICGWMGIAGQTQWDLYTGDETEEVADGIVTIIRWFHGRWQELVWTS